MAPFIGLLLRGAATTIYKITQNCHEIYKFYKSSIKITKIRKIAKIIQNWI
jgi:hypothetical protein